MTTKNPSGEDRRRSERVLRRTPLRVAGENHSGQRVDERAEATVVSRHGALIKCKSRFRPGAELSITADQGRRQAHCRVIWAKEKPLEETWELGVELSADEKAPWEE